MSAFAQWWDEHEPRDTFLDDWTHDDVRLLCLAAWEAAIDSRRIDSRRVEPQPDAVVDQLRLIASRRGVQP